MLKSPKCFEHIHNMCGKVYPNSHLICEAFCLYKKIYLEATLNYLEAVVEGRG